MVGPNNSVGCWDLLEMIQIKLRFEHSLEFANNLEIMLHQLTHPCLGFLVKLLTHLLCVGGQSRWGPLCTCPWWPFHTGQGSWPGWATQCRSSHEWRGNVLYPRSGIKNWWDSIEWWDKSRKEEQVRSNDLWSYSFLVDKLWYCLLGIQVIEIVEPKYGPAWDL